MTGEVDSSIKFIGDVKINMEASTNRTFYLSDIEKFRDLAPDLAPVHSDKMFSKDMGYDDVLVFGWLAAAPFSGLLGMKLPGPNTVLHSVKISMSAPVYPNEDILYKVKISHISMATGVVVLELKATRVKSQEIVIRGQAQCGFRLHNSGFVKK